MQRSTSLMKPVLILCLFISPGYLLTSCKTSHYKASNNLSPQYSAIDTNNVAIIPFGPEVKWIFDSTHKAATLSNEEALLVDRILKKCVFKYNKSIPEKNKSDFSIDFSKYQYRRQYVVAVNGKGEKIVWINGLCHTWDDKWKREVIEVLDGGNCYFAVKINLSKMRCFGIGIHGFA